MAPELDLDSTECKVRAVSPSHEMGAYNAL